MYIFAVKVTDVIIQFSIVMTITTPTITTIIVTLNHNHRITSIYIIVAISITAITIHRIIVTDDSQLAVDFFLTGLVVQTRGKGQGLLQ